MSRTDTDLLYSPEHRKRTGRQARHAARAALHEAVLDGDPDVLDDVAATPPETTHDLGRRRSPKPQSEPKPGRRPGFKVWKTAFWKRRTVLRASRNRAAERLAAED